MKEKLAKGETEIQKYPTCNNGGNIQAEDQQAEDQQGHSRLTGINKLDSMDIYRASTQGQHNIFYFQEHMEHSS